MSGFSAEWLALREPADVASRSDALTRFVVDHLFSRDGLTALDLGTGTGSNLRYLAPRLPQPQHWRIVDDDPRLLEQAAFSAPDAQSLRSDLAVLSPEWFEGIDLVTASALLDLVSESWLGRLVDRCRAARAAVLAVINYDGRIVCTPPDVDDPLVVDLVNAHQRTDKGLGPALGPDAGRTLASKLTSAGYDVRRASSDWVLGAESRTLQRALIGGWAGAARELRPSDRARIDAWERRRISAVDDTASRIVVGHDDVAGVLR